MRRGQNAWAAVVAGMAGVLLASLPPQARAADPAPVIAAERKFAADGAANGVKASFLRAMAKDAVVFAPGPVNAKAFYSKRPAGKGAHVLTWWPTYAGLSASGEFGFTTGPYAIDGQRGGWFFTVWVRQADGTWKWIFDDGTESDAAAGPPPTAPVEPLNEARWLPDSSRAAMVLARKAEAKLAAGAKTDLAGAYAEALSYDARVQGSSAAPAMGPEAVADELARRPKQVVFTPKGGRAAGAGDLVFTYGEARWTEAGRPRSGHYARFWRSDLAGFRIVFDQLVPTPEPAK